MVDIVRDHESHDLLNVTLRYGVANWIAISMRNALEIESNFAWKMATDSRGGHPAIHWRIKPRQDAQQARCDMDCDVTPLKGELWR